LELNLLNLLKDASFLDLNQDILAPKVIHFLNLKTEEEINFESNGNFYGKAIIFI
jgi:hypothetical protein